MCLEQHILLISWRLIASLPKTNALQQLPACLTKHAGWQAQWLASNY
jgi:hypothetical protein